MSVFEMLITAYCIVSYVVVGYIVLRKPKTVITLMDVILWAVSPVIFPVILGLSGMFYYQDKQLEKRDRERQLRDRLDSPWSNLK